MDTEVDELRAPGEPGPRRARADDEAASRRPARVRRAAGIGLLVVGLVVAGLAARSALSDDGPEQRPVGRLTGSDLTGEKAASTGSDDDTKPTTSVQDATTTAKGGEPTGSTDTTDTTPPTGSTEKAEPAWPSATGGKPPALGKQGEPPPADVGDLEPGYYLWNDFAGWHIWLVGGDGSERVTITSDGEIAKADPAGEPVGIERLENAFAFSRDGAEAQVVGVDFNPGYYAKTFVVTINGEARLHIGARRWGAPRFFGVQKSTANS